MSDSMAQFDTLGFAVSDTTVSDQMFTQDTVDAFALEESLADSASSDTIQVYFRKKINLEGTPVDGYIYMTADNDFNFFLNEEYITDDEYDNFAIIDTVDFGYISYAIRGGINTLALRVIDTDNTRQGVKIYGYIELIPADIMAAMEARSTVAALNVDREVLRRLNILNKNRISITQ
jgi:hypothetical protein